MHNILFKTHNNTPPTGKPKVFFFSTERDFNQYFDHICQLLNKIIDCCIFYLEDCESIDSETLESLSTIPLWVFPITNNFLESDNTAKSIVLPYAFNNHIPVIPIAEEMELAYKFNKMCGDYQLLSEAEGGNDFSKKLAQRVNEVLLGDELAEKIRSAFAGYVFLSYRKKDRKEADRLSRLIHNNEAARDIAIWIDDYLIPGENFNDTIKNNLDKSDLFALCVTPNLTEIGNYVLDIEYPMAIKLGKLFIPVEMKKTDHDEFGKFYPDVRQLLNYDSDDFDEKVASIITEALSLIRNDEPEHLYLIGLAYLMGIDVNIDREKGLDLLKKAGEAGFPEACRRLNKMYYNGEFVERDIDSALYWANKLLDIVKEKDSFKDYPQAYNNVAALYHESGEYDEADSILYDARDMYETINNNNDPDFEFYKIMTYANHSSLNADNNYWDYDYDIAKKMLNEAIDGLIRLIDEHPEEKKYRAFLAELYLQQARLSGLSGDGYDAFYESHKKSLKLSKGLAEEDNINYAMDYLLQLNNTASAFLDDYYQDLSKSGLLGEVLVMQREALEYWEEFEANGYNDYESDYLTECRILAGLQYAISLFITGKVSKGKEMLQGLQSQLSSFIGRDIYKATYIYEKLLNAVVAAGTMYERKSFFAADKEELSEILNNNAVLIDWAKEILDTYGGQVVARFSVLCYSCITILKIWKAKGYDEILKTDYTKYFKTFMETETEDESQKDLMKLLAIEMDDTARKLALDNNLLTVSEELLTDALVLWDTVLKTAVFISEEFLETKYDLESLKDYKKFLQDSEDKDSYRLMLNGMNSYTVQINK